MNFAIRSYHSRMNSRWTPALAWLTLAGVGAMFASPAFDLPETALRCKQLADHHSWAWMAATLLVAFDIQSNPVAAEAAVVEARFVQPELVDLTCARLC
jgi:hypothetical protein